MYVYVYIHTHVHACIYRPCIERVPKILGLRRPLCFVLHLMARLLFGMRGPNNVHGATVRMVADRFLDEALRFFWNRRFDITSEGHGEPLFAFLHRPCWGLETRVVKAQVPALSCSSASFRWHRAQPSETLWHHTIGLNSAGVPRGQNPY